MSDHTMLDRMIRESLDENAPFAAPNHLLQSFEFNARRTRPYPRWLALIKEPTMRIDQRLAVGSPTARVAAIAVTTLLLAAMIVGAGVAGARLLAADSVIVVDPSGAGDFLTITDAVAAATGGDEILVRPGSYTESLLVDKDITIRGDGRPEDVIVQMPTDGPVVEWFQYALSYAIHLSDADAVIRDLSIRTPNLSTSGIVVTGGSPIIENVIVDVPEVGTPSPRGFVYVAGEAMPEIRDSSTDGFVWITGGADATISGLHVLPGADELGIRVDGAGAHATVTGSELIEGIVHNGAAASFVDNTFADAGGTSSGCSLAIEKTDSGVVVRGNVFEGGVQGTCVRDSTDTRLIGNEFVDTGLVGVSAIDSETLLAGNTLRTAGIGVALRGGETTMDGNVIEGNRVGVSIQTGDTVAHLVENRVCSNETDILVADDAPPPTVEDAVMCSDEA